MRVPSRKIITIFVLSAAIIAGLTSITLANNRRYDEQQAANQLASAKAACALSPQTFLDTVNQWRAEKGVAPLQLSSQLQQAAQARVADMVKYQYYGHVNPQTKQDNIYFTDKYDSAATYSTEVLDGPENAAQSLPDFKNSPSHYQALTDSHYTYIGLLIQYQPEQWAEYDNNGALQAPAGKYSSNCIIVGDLADKIGSAPANTSQPTTQQPPYQRIPPWVWNND